jgi:predicted lipoprotein
MLKKLVFWSVAILVSSCGGEEPSDVTDDFDRGEMLSNWADNIIMPAYVNYQAELSGLKTQGAAFTNEPTVQNLDNLRTSWINAYKAWQHVSMFEVGKAESLNVRNYTNIYPTDPSGINDNIASFSYNLELPSKND